jgi:hypothetical protein
VTDGSALFLISLRIVPLLKAQEEDFKKDFLEFECIIDISLRE